MVSLVLVKNYTWRHISHKYKNDVSDDNGIEDDINNSKKKNKNKKCFHSEVKSIIVFASSNGTSVVVTYHKNLYRGLKTGYVHRVKLSP
jgi:hypothetical protein